MEVIVVGLNHRTAPVEVREKLAFSKELLDEALDKLRRCEGVYEGFILSTCNRVEICAVVADAQVGRKSIHEFLEHIHQENIRGALDTHFYFYESREAIRHIFRVASSLDSMVLGEPQILGQLKDAFEDARGRRTTGIILNRLFNKALSAAKRVRTQTGIAESPVSVSSAAVELAGRIFGQMEHITVLLVGSGEMAELAARHLSGEGVRRIKVTGRSLERAEALAKVFQGEAVSLETLLNQLREADIVICSTGAGHYLVSAAQMREVIQDRKNRPIFLIDLSVPRNIDPEVNQIDNVYLYDIDDLQLVVEGNKQRRQHEAQKAEAIVDEEVQVLCRWLKSLDVVPTIVALREMAEEIRQAETQKVMGKLSEVSPVARQALDAVTQSLVNKLLHAPLTVLKREANSSDGALYLDAVRKLFNLDGEVVTRHQPGSRREAEGPSASEGCDPQEGTNPGRPMGRVD